MAYGIQVRRHGEETFYVRSTSGGFAYLTAHLPWSVLETKLTPRSAILDLGTGTGDVVETLRARGYENAVGIDLVLNETQQGKSYFSVSDAFHMSFPPEAFDVVLCVRSVLSYESEDLAAVTHLLTRIQRILRPGGHLFIIPGRINLEVLAAAVAATGGLRTIHQPAVGKKAAYRSLAEFRQEKKEYVEIIKLP